MYRNVIKLLYQNLHQDSALIRAFKTGYNRVSALVDLPQRTRLLLTLLTAAGIYRYLDRFTDPNFRRCAETMLTNVARFHLQSASCTLSFRMSVTFPVNLKFFT